MDSGLERTRYPALTCGANEFRPPPGLPCIGAMLPDPIQYYDLRERLRRRVLQISREIPQIGMSACGMKRRRQGVTQRGQSLLAAGAWSDNTHPLPNPSKHLQRLLQFLLCVCCGHDGADAGFTLGNGGEGDAGAEDTFFE
jgi:hypothetical protein